MTHSTKTRTAFRWMGSAVLLAMLAFGINPAFAAETAQGGDIVVTGLKGDVRVTMRGEPRAVKQGTVVQLAATVQTGADGSLQLRQSNTTFSVASDSRIDLPAGAVLGDPIDRVMQTRGNVLYDVGKRGARKLRVETPYLVAVIKGTQFNVAVQRDSSVISLFEGLLEVRATDGSDVVELHAGEIAIRGRNDRAIRVITMDTGQPVARAETRHGPLDTSDDGSISSGAISSGPRTTTAPVESELARVSPRVGDSGVAANDPTSTIGGNGGVTASIAVDVDDSTPDITANLGLQAGGKAAPVLGVDLGATINPGSSSAGVGLDVNAGIAGTTVDVGLTTGVDVGAGTVAVGLDTGVDVAGAASVDVGATVGADLGAGAVDVGVSAGVDVAGTAVDVGVTTGVDLGGGAVSLGLDAGVDVGGAAAVDAGVSVGADLAASTVDVGVGAGVDLGAAAVDVGVDAGVDLGAAAVDAAVDAGVAGIDAGVAAAVDLSSGTVAADVGVAGISVGLDVDLAAGVIDLGVGTVTPTAPTPPAAGGTSPGTGGGLLGGIVGGLLGRSN